MNFEMAQEMAQMEDIKVESVIVRDDIAISDPKTPWCSGYSICA